MPTIRTTALRMSSPHSVGNGCHSFSLGAAEASRSARNTSPGGAIWREKAEFGGVPAEIVREFRLSSSLTELWSAFSPGHKAGDARRTSSKNHLFHIMVGENVSQQSHVTRECLAGRGSVADGQSRGIG